MGMKGRVRQSSRISRRRLASERALSSCLEGWFLGRLVAQ